MHTHTHPHMHTHTQEECRKESKTYTQEKKSAEGQACTPAMPAVHNTLAQNRTWPRARCWLVLWPEVAKGPSHYLTTTNTPASTHSLNVDSNLLFHSLVIIADPPPPHPPGIISTTLVKLMLSQTSNNPIHPLTPIPFTHFLLILIIQSSRFLKATHMDTHL